MFPLLYLLGDKARSRSKELSFTYHIAFVSDKEEQSRIHSAEDWFRWVEAWVQQLKNPIEIKKDE